MKTAIAIMALVLLTGCASDAYYQSLTAQFDAQVKEYELRQARLEKEQAMPLVDHRWTDIEGNTHSIVVNQPVVQLQDDRQRPQFKIPAPWEGWFSIFDRTLSFGERMLPSYLSFLALDNDEDSSGDTNIYNSGKDNNFMLTDGNYNSPDMMQDYSVTQTTTSEIVTP